MRIPVKINLANPILYAIGFVFLFLVPYLYPVSHFQYTKVFSPSIHLLISCFIISLVVFSFYLSKIRFTRRGFNPQLQISTQFYHVCKAGLYVALFMNTLIVLNALQAYMGATNIFSAKKSLEEFGGINILSQTYMFFLPPYIYYSYRHKKAHKLLLATLGFTLLARSVLMAERVAFLEFLVPVLVTYYLATDKKVYLTKILKYFSLLLMFFMLLELSRQFYNQYLAKGDSVDIWFALSWTLERFFAYYSDTANKFYFVVAHDLGFTTQQYLTPFIRIIQRVADFELNTVSIEYGEFRWRDFTNPGGLTMLFTDFGYLSIFIFMSFFVMFFKAFRSLKEGSIFALCIYPNLVTVILELPRFVNFYNTRFFVPLFAFISVYIVFKYLTSRFPKIKFQPKLEKR